MKTTTSTGRPERLKLIRDLIVNPAADPLTQSLERLREICIEQRRTIADMKAEAAVMRSKLAVANRRLGLLLIAHEMNGTESSQNALARDYKILHGK